MERSQHGSGMGRRGLAGVAALAFAISACSTTGRESRGIAQTSQPLTYEQLAKIREAGVGIMTLAMLSNRVRQEDAIGEEMRTKLDGIGINGEGRFGRGSVMATATAAGLLILGMGLGSAGELLESVRVGDKSMSGFGGSVGVTLVGSAAIGASLTASESSGSSTGWLRGGDARRVRDEADGKRQAAFRDFEAQLKEAADAYARIFRITGDRKIILEQELRAEAVAEGQRLLERDRKLRAEGRPVPPSEGVTIDVARVAADAQLITGEEHEAYLALIQQLRDATRTDGAVEKVVDGARFGANLELAKAAMREYLEVLRQALPRLPEADRKAVQSELGRAERLIVRL